MDSGQPLGEHHLTIAIAPGSFKGTVTSTRAATAIAEGVRRALPSALIHTFPLADGGEGTIEVLERYCGGVVRICNTVDAIGQSVQARWLKVEDEAYVQVSEVIGLSRIPVSSRNPLSASSEGLADVLVAAIAERCRRIFVCLGDTATMDVGVGMLSRLGARFYDRGGKEVKAKVSSFGQISSVDVTECLAKVDHVQMVCLADTTNTLGGPQGHAAVYGHQKGMQPEDVALVTHAIANIGSVLERSLGVDIVNKTRTSAGGGVAAALHGVFGAPLISTLDYLSDRVPFLQRFKESDLVITGEGRLDASSAFGKVPTYVSLATPGPCLAVVGDITNEGLSWLTTNQNRYFAVCPHLSPGLSPTLALESTVESAIRMMALGGRLKGAIVR